ncbi:MAG TPA: hypothetical protein PKE69_18190 [Pyrinomonadaceae bacterium]|nr:hypothetical protein [Pyrinomonadaceae bacterium]
MIKKLSGKEKIGEIDNGTVLDFWSWAYSDILSNRNRSIFAEFLVATALGETDNPRIEWDAVDLRYQGKKIEVKSAAYVQSWQQNKLSTIRFDIGKKLGWFAETNSFGTLAERNADCYVFCLFTEQNREEANILDVEKWIFFVAQTRQLEERFNNQKSVSLNYLKEICLETNFRELKQVIEKVLS